MDRQRIGWFVRGLLLVGVFGLALHAFRAGVAVTNRTDLAGADLMTQIYYAAGLFVMGGLDLGMPVGGPLVERATLWGAYFAAPLITTSAVIEGALRLVGSGAIERVGLNRHLVVVGLGRLGTTFVAAFRKWEPHTPILAMDRDISQAPVAHARQYQRVVVLQGDAHLKRALDGARLSRARAVALVTDDDLTNLEVAFRLAKEHPSLRVVAHVSDIGMRRAVRDIRDAEAGERVFVFNAHRMAARHLYDDHLRAYFKVTAARDPVVLAGFGRFGQTILEFLDRQAHGEIARLLVIDHDAKLALRKYRDQVAGTLSTPEPVNGDLADPETWDRIAGRLEGFEAPPVIIVGGNDDIVNLKCALHVRRRWPEARLFVRCQNESSFTEELAKRHRIEPLAVQGILLRALESEQKRWFGTGAPPKSP